LQPFEQHTSASPQRLLLGVLVQPLSVQTSTVHAIWSSHCVSTQHFLQPSPAQHCVPASHWLVSRQLPSTQLALRHGSLLMQVSLALHSGGAAQVPLAAHV
jgi:hypothetical protein